MPEQRRANRPRRTGLARSRAHVSAWAIFSILEGLVECNKCDRRGHYRVRTLVDEIGLDGRLSDWLLKLTADCPRRQAGRFGDMCAAQCPDLVALFGSGSDH